MGMQAGNVSQGQTCEIQEMWSSTTQVNNCEYILGDTGAADFFILI